MIIVKMKRENGQGFTIIELLIATTVFSVVLLLAMTGFFQIGHIFYKGVSITQSQDVANSIGLDISDSVEGASQVTALNDHPTASGIKYMCAGKNRYTLNLGHAVNVGDSTALANGSVGLVKDILSSDNICPPPCLPNPASCSGGQVGWTKPVELLGDNMRIESLNVQPLASVSTSYYTISVVISYGDTDLVTYTDSNDHSTALCKSQQGSQFCAIGRYSASINRAIGG